MAKTSVSLAVIFFFSVFVISHARTSFNLPANEWKSISTTPISESDSSDTLTSENLHKIQLPTEKSESDDVEKRVIDHPIEEQEEEKLPESDTTTTTTAAAITAIGITEPFKVTYDVSFRPINRHFHHMHMNRPLFYRFPHRHNCRHNHHHRFHGNDNEKSSSISYGNDMILSDEQKAAEFVHPMFQGDMRHVIPARLGQFRAGDEPIPVKPLKVNGESTLTKEIFLPHVEEKKTETENGFMKRFRKFLFDRF